MPERKADVTDAAAAGARPADRTVPDGTALWLVGIGTGNPEHLTAEARRALCEAAVVLVPRKGPDKEDLAELRRRLLADCASPARVVEFDMPVRDEALPYRLRVAHWHDAIAACWARAIRAAGPQGPVALMVWGDPGLYDSSLRIARRLDPPPRIRVVPGISALQALTAAHGIPLAEINGEVTVTTGRRLRERGWPPGAGSVAVMLDGELSFRALAPEGLHIWWGAYLGMPEEALDSGPLAEAGPRIAGARAALRARHGWIMDTYLIRRTAAPDGEAA
jgi:precorrin-6A synthase